MPHITPITVKAALKQVKAWHRHLPDLQGGLFAVGISDGGNLVGVAIAGNPSRVWQGDGKILISRCALLPDLSTITDRHGTVHAYPGCTMAYGALARAARALGYREAWTYTLNGEDGRSVRAAGFLDMGMTDGGEHSRPSRPRLPAVRPEPKRRWMRRLSGEQL